MKDSAEVSRLLVESSEGNRAAFDQLWPLVYDELHRLAARHMRHESEGHTLQTTALVNEAYLRLVDHDSARWENRVHFFAVASKVMRQILIDHARQHARAKRGGGDARLSLDDVAIISGERSADLLALDEALQKLAENDKRKAEVVEMRFFGGMTIEETAAVLNLTSKTVNRDWQMARAWLHREIARQDQTPL